MIRKSEQVVVVTRRTRFDAVKAKFGTAGQARFVLRQQRKMAFREMYDRDLSDVAADVEFEKLSAEDSTYDGVIEQLKNELNVGLPVTFIDRDLLPTYDFRWATAVVAVGQDGLVANTAKYIHDAPLIGINPDPKLYDGVLLPFAVHHARAILKKTLEKKAKFSTVSLAEATMNDGQSLLAFNDFFIGQSSHASALYTITANGQTEPHSSSGVLICTGAGSTGWMSSVFNMATGIAKEHGHPIKLSSKMKWSDRELLWAVREPFISKSSKATLLFGKLNENDSLIIESRMGQDGVVFSDGIEHDSLSFNAGTQVTIRVAKQRAKLVIA